MTGRPPEEERLQELYQRNQERLLRIAAGILGPGPRAEDAVHDAILLVMSLLLRHRRR